MIQHEKHMTEPLLSTIQASVLVRPILVLSRDPTAYKFAFLHFARIISVGTVAEYYWIVDPLTLSDGRES